MIDARNSNLFLTEFMLNCPKIGRLRFSSLNHFRLTFGHLSFSLIVKEIEFFVLQIVTTSSSGILVYLWFFQSFLIHSKKIISKRSDPDSFKYKPFRLKFLLVILLLLIMPILNCSRWLVNWLAVRVAFPLSDKDI